MHSDMKVPTPDRLLLPERGGIPLHSTSLLLKANGTKRCLSYRTSSLELLPTFIINLRCSTYIFRSPLEPSHPPSALEATPFQLM